MKAAYLQHDLSQRGCVINPSPANLYHSAFALVPYGNGSCHRLHKITDALDLPGRCVEPFGSGSFALRTSRFERRMDRIFDRSDPLHFPRHKNYWELKTACGLALLGYSRLSVAGRCKPNLDWKLAVFLDYRGERVGVDGSGVVRIDIRRHSIGFGQFLFQRDIAEHSSAKIFKDLQVFGEKRNVETEDGAHLLRCIGLRLLHLHIKLVGRVSLRKERLPNIP